MKKNSTILCFVDSLDKPSVKLVNVNQLMDEIDEALEDMLRDVEIEAPPSLVRKTLNKINKEPQP